MNVALPSILFGLESIPFSEETAIEYGERVQSQLAKYILGLPQYAANFCAQTELGWKPFRQVLYDRQLCFYRRLLLLPVTQWANAAIREHLVGGWNSPYFSYISGVLDKIGVTIYLPTANALKLQTMHHFF